MVDDKDKLDIEDLRDQIEELRSSLPAHSIPPAMLIELDDLELELEKRLAENSGGTDAEA